ncbi:hypothetical protein TI05_10240 [Achromatium sp. WMS3]|nr:hypothetical protein TI05_10240 [Achromatium sp. WMS3]
MLQSNSLIETTEESKALAKLRTRPSLLPAKHQWQQKHCPDIGHADRVSTLVLSSDGQWPAYPTMNITQKRRKL